MSIADLIKSLGACNPPFAHKALSMEEKIGILLPCNVVVLENEEGKVEVSIMDPAVAMSVVENPSLKAWHCGKRKTGIGTEQYLAFTSQLASALFFQIGIGFTEMLISKKSSVRRKWRRMSRG
jgi:hypothetical protein